MIWEFWVEGIGYLDEVVYGWVKYYFWLDYYLLLFCVVFVVIGGMRIWLNFVMEGEDLEEVIKKRVVVVYCKVGKGRLGMMVCSYFIVEEGWMVEDVLRWFMDWRMKVGFGEGVSIFS